MSCTPLLDERRKSSLISCSTLCKSNYVWLDPRKGMYASFHKVKSKINKTIFASFSSFSHFSSFSTRAAAHIGLHDIGGYASELISFCCLCYLIYVVIMFTNVFPICFRLWSAHMQAENKDLLFLKFVLLFIFIFRIYLIYLITCRWSLILLKLS